MLYGAVAGLAVTIVRTRFTGGLARETKVPFGTYLCLGLWLVWLYGPLVQD